MTITAIDITQDNTVGVVDLLAVHNPLVFIAVATWNTDVPNNIYAEIDSTVYKMAFYEDLSATQRAFLFVSEEILRSLLPALVDISQSVDTIIEIPDLILDVTIDFTKVAEGVPADSVDIIACHAARDFEDENGAAMVDIWNNESQYYVGAVDQDVYLYWWNDNAANIINGDIGINIGINIAATAANIKAYIIADSTYSDFIKGTTGAGSIWCYVSGDDVIFQAENGAITTFSAVSLGASFSSVITNNASATAKLTITLDFNPSDGEVFEFNFDISNVPTPPGGIDVEEFMGVTGGTTYAKGFIRKLIQPSASGITEQSITIYDQTFTHTLKTRPWCDGDLLLKYVDRNGQYRFFPFTRFYIRRSNPIAIGTIDELIISLATDTGDTREIGYKNKDNLTLSAAQLNTDEKALLKDLYTSPEVYLVEATKLVRVKVAGDNISKLAKDNFSDLTIDILLPSSYNITEL
jgi:hypothetical protein